jgi:conjugative relaxase-like TrwC/TraI family protein
LAVVVTIAKGYDLGYIWKTQDHKAERTGGYYLNAAQAGEPPGRWWGPGAQALGLALGQTVNRKPYDAVYRQTDPRTGARLGRPRGRYPTFADHLARLQAAEPHATAERLIELEREAARATRQPAAYYDVTVSFSKSISVLHASLRENERRARMAGGQQAAVYWAGREQQFQEVLHRANRDALEYMQTWAGITRTGYHGTRIDGREPGRFEPAGLIVTSWLQGTSRDGDPQDHIHNQIVRITRTISDGKWRALDTMSMRAVLGALQAVAATTVECELTREFGVDWVPRADGRGNEIRGVTQAQMDAYSTRTVQVRVKERELAQDWERKRGRAPTSRELLYIANAATLQSRKGKEPGAIDWDALARQWDATLGGALAAIAPAVSDARGPGIQGREHHAGQAPSGLPAPEAQARALAKALTLVSSQHPAWTRHDLLKQLALVLPAETRQMSPEEAQELLLGLAEEALSGRSGEVVCLEAARAYVAAYLAGRNVLLMAADWARCRELSQRIRDDLIHLGLVDGGRTIRIADGAEASAGDLIICRANDHHLEAGEPGRALANGDVLRIEAITRRGIMVRRLLDPDPATGQQRFTVRAFRYEGYQSSDLAYAITGHSAQGATVHTGIALVTGTEDRQWLYPALTRGTDANLAYVFTTPSRPADPQPGTRSAPELGCYDRARRERAGYPAPPPSGAQPGRADQREPIAVLADVLSRDGAEQSASAIRQRNLAHADHLAILHAIWAAETQAARHDRYRDLVTAALPPGHRQPFSHQARWLFRTLHAAELAGLDPAEVIRTAITSRELAGSRDIAAVLDARIRPRIDPLLPQPQGPWAGRVPELPDPDRRAYLAQISAMMDDRTRRLGQHTAQTAPTWAVTALGPVPANSAARRDWEYKAAAIAAYREMYGYDHPGDPIGPEPSHQAPGQRAAWHEAFLAAGPPAGPGVRALPDGRLWLLRDIYAAETAWAPRHVGKELRLARLGAFDAGLGAIRATAEADTARKADDQDRAARHEYLAASYRALRDHYQQQERALARAMADRQEWEQATARSRYLAIAAAAELRRRHPTRKIEPLRSAEPVLVSDAGRQHQDLVPQGSSETTPIRDLEAQRQAFRARMDEHRNLAPREDAAWSGLGEASPALPPWGDAILQPPKPQITPSAEILQLAAEHDIEPEAGG